MNRKIAVALVGATVVLAACSSASDVADPPPPPPPVDSTPAPDATEGIGPGLEEFYTQTLHWETCGGDFQCTTLTVPLDYADPGGETIDLSVLRSPATGEDVAGSLLVNPGGPGASGVDYARAARSVATEDVLDQYDIVGFDPRGVASSAPIDCLEDADLDEYVASDASPDDDAEIAGLQEQARTLAEGCQTNAGDLLPHIGTPDVARDLDVLRATLGDETLTYLGKSYGTFIGATYAGLFPERVGRMVLDGAIDPALSGHDLALGQAEGFERAWSAFVEWCLEEDECPLGDDDAEVRQTLADFLADVDAEPLPTGDDNRPLTDSLALYGIVLPLYLTATEGYPPLAAALEQAIDEEDGEGLLALADIYLARSNDGTYTGNENEAIVAVNCLDRPEQTTPDQAKAGLAEFEAASPLFGPFLAWGGLGCAEWPVQPAAGPAQITAAGAPPILVVGTTGDPATPYEWAEALAGQLESGVLLTYEGTVHTAYLTGSDCVDQAVDEYLLDGVPPEDGLRCS